MLVDGEKVVSRRKPEWCCEVSPGRTVVAPRGGPRRRARASSTLLVPRRTPERDHRRGRWRRSGRGLRWGSGRNGGTRRAAVSSHWLLGWAATRWLTCRFVRRLATPIMARVRIAATSTAVRRAGWGTISAAASNTPQPASAWLGVVNTASRHANVDPRLSRCTSADIPPTVAPNAVSTRPARTNSDARSSRPIHAAQCRSFADGPLLPGPTRWPLAVRPLGPGPSERVRLRSSRSRCRTARAFPPGRGKTSARGTRRAPPVNPHSRRVRMLFDRS